MLNLICDSGAYTAFTQHKEINLEKYIKFCQNNSKYISTVVNLDVIAPNDPDVAAFSGRQNFLRMRDAGIVSLPVFHARENLKWLDFMLNEVPYVGISATSLVSPVEARAWLRLCWNYMTDSRGLPIVETHSFGDTSPYSMLSMPWTTADSATWMIQAGRAARVKLQGKSYQLRSNSIGDVNFISKDDTGPKREMWEQEIRDLGLDPSALMSNNAKGSELAMMRSFLVAADLLKLQEQTRYVTKFLKPSSLITNKKQLDGGFEREGPVKIYFVISPSAYYFNFSVIRALNIKNILVSYYYVDTAPKNFWEEILVPFLCDPDDFCERDPKVKKFWEKLNEVLLKPEAIVA